ncbi:hypothetical protein K469DRAFT_724182 [Zopfia rhizophila CBS 207.26]|uniref:Uncharacterized protein n=1 Tax=Zopfia rhizophila CBS 207.26 TaxID=1314779 RepID=A0A6A6DBD7_9PEZI|nr:hypothetical protein K469DRAFT_724182 [Zopfia rhizophila CBS 207.26]
MSSTLRMIQLNVRKQGEVHNSLINNKEIQGTAVLVNKEIEAEQVRMESLDITVAVIRLQKRQVLVILVYLYNNLRKAIHKIRRNASTIVNIGGEDVTLERQNKTDLIINLITEFVLSSLLLQGTKTWHSRDYKTTINLVLVLEELMNTTLKYRIYKTEHSSDHRAIKTIFNILVLVLK